MATGSITITPGKVWDTVNGELIDLSKLNQTANPTARVDENTIGRRELITAFVTQVDDATSAIVTLQDQVADVTGYAETRYTLNVIANNVVTGMTLYSASGPDTEVSYVLFQADRFQIYTATGGNKEIFSATATEVRLGGVLTVDVANTKVYLGAGNYNNADTGFYVDASGNFSLKDKLTWDGSTLTITGGGTFSGALSAASGTFAGSLSAATGTFAGALSAATGTFAGTLSAADGTFTGSLTAATGTFAGSLSAATGTFAGSLSAATGTFAGALSAATGTFSGSVDVGTGLLKTSITTSGAVFGATSGNYVDVNNLAGGAGLRLVDSGGTERISLKVILGSSLITCENISATGVLMSQFNHSGTASATTPGSVVRKLEVLDGAGGSLGFIPLYDSIS